MATHRHKAAEMRDQPYWGPVNMDRENPAAHGFMTRVERCVCGAERHRNINGRHVESSGWVEPKGEEG